MNREMKKKKGKLTGDGGASPDYNIYSDSDAMPSEPEKSAQKEGGSPE